MALGNGGIPSTKYSCKGSPEVEFTCIRSLVWRGLFDICKASRRVRYLFQIAELTLNKSSNHSIHFLKELSFEPIYARTKIKEQLSDNTCTIFKPMFFFSGFVRQTAKDDLIYKEALSKEKSRHVL